MPSTSTTNAVIVDTTNSPHVRLRPAPLTAVRIDDAFWAPRRRINAEVTIPAQHRLCEETSRIDNFRRASGRKKDIPFVGIFFNDSDVYKWLESAAWALAENPDPALTAMVDSVIDEIAAAQQPDGYLNTYYMFERASERYSNLKDMHELYCDGHLIQAAVAHHRATGKDSLLTIARKLADHLYATFGPEEHGKRPGCCGHEEVEMALVELSRDTGDAKYLELARYLVEARGHQLLDGSSYHQDHLPFTQQRRMTGHAVRHVYLACGATDVLAESGDPQYREALEALWRNMTLKQMYVSGGIGSRWEGEAFGRDYELPNERAYTETCAAIGSVMWNWRMLAVTAEARFADIAERQLYNAVMPGLSLDGQAYFYQNPLTDDGTHRREPWFGCACCPPNVARLLASLPGYFYSVNQAGIYTHLYAQGSADLTLPDMRKISLTTETRYPWQGDIAITVDGEGEFSLFLRIPGWADEGVSLTVNGDAVPVDLYANTYAEVKRRWRKGDVVRLSLPMQVRRVECHPYAAENVGRVALMRGPLLYCLEGVDHPGVDLRDIVLRDDVEVSAAFDDALLGGVVKLSAQAQVVIDDGSWATNLYRAKRAPGDAQPVDITAIPYYAWANRAPGRLQVWLRTC